MAQARKFNMISGVFTPSILTILGVIMYLRLPWIVGQAGLFMTIGIIIVAHIISVTTGLSVSSIATDKKVKAGGSYYIISRSLGLPIGGTLGLALFVGLSFSVSLYLIGFSESFLSYWGFEVNKTTIRIAGSIALFSVTAITFISTALALKTQYFILSAIVLSLISIFFGSTEFTPSEPLFSSLPEAAPWMVLFGIFFPAVTGFEAGVSMSGDLQDPKRDIPLGTIAAVSVGLVTYIGLAIFFSYRVNADQLVNNSNILLDISFFPPLVIAGIWGATLSSAMGSILGAPRILQAASQDKITPKFFGVGYGKENEPRNALIMTFLIAEAGILIGELDVIARVVSMFFITAYGFLNLSAALESWASPDFRPDFRVPKTVSIIGSLACFLVMILLDFAAMIGATLVMGGVFLFLKRRELTLESGDTWEGVWSSVVRTGLSRLSRGSLHQRNWRPNLILFSGGADARPHLVELGKWLVFKRGVLSDFELIESAGKEKALAKGAQDISGDDEDAEGLFTRRLVVDNIYTGMENVCSIYGFSGIEPNTVLMGWGRYTKQPAEFVTLLQSLKQMDYNILLLDYDEERGFGKKNRIDVWWRGGNNNFTLILYMTRFLLSTDAWTNARLRLMIINNDSALTNTIYKNADRIFEEYRLEAEVKVIPNGIEQRPFDEIVRNESADAALVILGMPPLDRKRAKQFVSKLDTMTDDLGSLLLVSASSYFEELHIGIEDTSLVSDTSGDAETKLAPLALPADDRLKHVSENINASLEKALAVYDDHFLHRARQYALQPVQDFHQLVERIFQSLKKQLETEDGLKRRKAIARSQSDYLFQARQIFRDYQEKNPEQLIKTLRAGMEDLTSQLKAHIAALPPTVAVYYDETDFQPEANDDWQLRWYKFRKRAGNKILNQQFSENIDIQRLLSHYIENKFYKDCYSAMETLAAASYQTIADLQKILVSIREDLQKIENEWLREDLDVQAFQAISDSALEKISKVDAAINTYYHHCFQQMAGALRENMAAVCRELPAAGLHLRLKKAYNQPKAEAAAAADLLGSPAVLETQLHTYLNSLLLELRLLGFQNRLRVVTQRLLGEINLNIEGNLLNPLESTCKMLQELREKSVVPRDAKMRLHDDIAFQFDAQGVISHLLEEVNEATAELPAAIDTWSEETLTLLESQPLEDGVTQTISLRRLVEYLIEESLVRPIQQHLNNVPARLVVADQTASDVLRLLAFHLEDAAAENDGEAAENDDTDSMIRNAESRLLEQFANVNQVYSDLNKAFEQHLQKTLEKLNSYTVTRSAGNLEHYILAQEGQKVLSGFGVARKSVENFVRERLVRLLYQRSKELIAVRRLEAGSHDGGNALGALLAYRKRLVPPSAVLDKLPYYYKELFLGSPPLNKNFWIGRKEVLQQAGRSVDYFRNGVAGGIAVLGNPRSGKSALCHYIARQHLSKHKVFVIDPPAGGSIEPAVFRETLGKALQSRGKIARMMNTLPEKSVLIFNDLELWWERSNKGFEVLKIISGLLSEYSDRHFIMVNCGKDSFDLMNRIENFESLFLDVLTCNPMGAEDLRHIIFRRHRSTGFKLEMGGLSEDALSEWRLAKLFNHLFDYARGNVGIALQAWIRGISKVNGNILEFASPELPEPDPLDNLESDWQMLLLQLWLHKALTTTRIARMLDEDEETVLALVSPLQRTGIVESDGEGILRISPYLQQSIGEYLKETGVL